MLTSLRIRNFQSLAEVDIDLGGFTVVVGPSNSGKSAVVRAIKALAENVNSPSSVRHGTRAFVVRADTDEGWSLLLQRGKGESTYRVIAEGREQIYAKSGTDVPEDVRRLLNMTETEGHALQFAGQFDRPFLLDEPASKVAKVLGDLTDLDVLYEAIREANRRRLATSQELKTRKGDLEHLREQAQGYASLAADRGVASEAATALEQALEREQRVWMLRERLAELDNAEVAIESIEIPELPAMNGVEDLARRLIEFRRVTDALSAAVEEERGAAETEQEAAAEVEKLESEHHAALQAAGTCPMCGRRIEP